MGVISRAPVIALAIALVFAIVAKAEAFALQEGTAGPRSVVDLGGRPVDPLHRSRDAKATVLIFTSVECPISNRYAPEMRRLYERFAASGVRFWLVYANPAEDAHAVRNHVKAFGHPMDAVLDPRHELVALAGATVTPEAAVFDVHRQMVYRGRIDDRYVDFGVDRPAPTSRDLQDALEATLAGRIVRTERTRAVGCLLPDVEGTRRTSPVTFAKDIAPLVFDRCAACHRPGGAAPFSLLTYNAVRQRAQQIAAVTSSRFMPPWKAEPESGEFIGQRRLTDAEIDLIRRWTDEGAPEGDPRHLPPPPRWTDGWQLGEPDVIVTFPEPYQLQADGTDVFRVFALRVPGAATRYVRGLEFRPGNPGVVHHANIRIDRTPASRELDARDPAPGYDGLLSRSAVYPEGHFLGWTPGQIAPLVPDALAWHLEPGTDLVIQLHMQPSGKPEVVQPSIGLFFGDAPPTRAPAIVRLGEQGIDIPAGESHYTIADSYVLPVDVEVQAVQPHAHYRAREIRGIATLPDGTTKWLIHITNWDFRWQHVYRSVSPFALPKGTTIAMHFSYDNSSDNARNPERPPARARWGQRSRDEMGDLWLQVLTRDNRDLAILSRDVRRKMVGDDIVGYEGMIRAYPGDAELHDDVALLYLEIGQPARAVAHFEASTALKPQAAPTHFNLGTALTVAGRLDDAVAAYRRALRIRPDYSSAHNNLGNVLALQGKLEDGMRHVRQALRLDPENGEARDAATRLVWLLASLPGSRPVNLATPSQ